jgi:hypothetical protein
VTRERGKRTREERGREYVESMSESERKRKRVKRGERYMRIP